ncbi:hypothetical protein DXG01_002618 [Tephrocybe rancida]|nr:hypothetical protein DXG01_002618 [Tephrocybe rancida]
MPADVPIPDSGIPSGRPSFDEKQFPESAQGEPDEVRPAATDVVEISSPKRDLRFWLVFVALCSCTLLSAIDLAGVGTAAPTIVHALQGKDFAWVFSAYALSSSSCIPLSGNLAQIFGRRPVIQAGIVVFAAGSAISGAAPTMTVLIVGRAIITADLVPLRERGLFTGITGLMWTLGSAIAPFIAGGLSEKASWRWLFYINLPLCGFALAVVTLFLKLKTPTETFRSKFFRIDWIGNAIIIASACACMIGLTWGGIEHPWSSFHVLVPLILGVGGLVFALFYEARWAGEPTIPFIVLSNRTSISGYVATFISGMVTINIGFYLPTWFQAVQDASPVISGLHFLPWAVSISGFAIVGGVIVSKVGRYRAIFAILAPLPISQNAAAVALLTFLRVFSQAWGVSIGGAILQNALKQKLPPALIRQFPDSANIAYSIVPTIPTLPEPLKHDVQTGFLKSFRVLWIATEVMCALGVLSIVFMKDLPLRRTVDKDWGLEKKPSGSESTLEENIHSPPVEDSLRKNFEKVFEVLGAPYNKSVILVPCHFFPPSLPQFSCTLMVLKLYAFSQSTNSRRAALILLEKDVPFELIDVDRVNNEHKGAEMLIRMRKRFDLNDAQEEDDGFVLFESRAIGRYIATKYAEQGTKLLPTDPKEIALFEQAASIEITNFDPLASAIFFENVYKPRVGLTPNKEVVEQQIKKLDAKLDAYDAILSKQKYLAGDELTLADLHHLPFALGLYQGGVDIIDTKPNVARMSPESAPYGTWTSPITAEAITKGALPIGGVVVDPITSKVYHLEKRPSEGGRVTIIDTSSNTELTSGEWNVRTGVHEYGGGAAIAHSGVIYFSHYSDGQVYRLKEGLKPEAVTPDFDVHPVHTHLLVSILEDHTIDEPSAIVNTLCIINTNTKTVHPLVSGADFYAAPKFSPDGTRLAWQQWSHPDMPWEGGLIYVADAIIDPDVISLSNVKHVAGEALKISAAFPSWANDDTLVFTSDESGYINPWKYQNGQAVPLFPTPVQSEFGSPGWGLQQFPYAILNDAGTMAVFITIKDGRDGLSAVDLTGGAPPLTLDTPYVAISNIWSLSRSSRTVVFSGEKVDTGSSLVRLGFHGSSDAIQYIAIKPAVAPEFSSEFVSIPQPLSIKDANGDPIHVVFYPPKHPKYAGSSIEGERPPCVLHAHGGPTMLMMQSLSWKVQYFTSRGWAWLDVNYGGSSGYGREYIDRLAGNWGAVDAGDCIQAAKILSSEPYNLIDPKRVVITGGSAGGYTVLAALANTTDATVFAAGTSSYGISDLFPLEAHTHKFEAKYLEKLIGGTSAQIPDVFRDRSPLNHADKIVAPLLILQGEIDKVVPKEQAELIYESVKAKGGFVEYKLYLGEGHGWRREENIVDALERELDFYERVLKLAK